MKPKTLFIMSSFNLYGGTPKKTLDLMNYLNENCVLYVYDNSYSEFKSKFEKTGAKIYEGFYGKNFIKHCYTLLKIIRENRIDIIQTQFSMGETLGFLIKLFNSKVKFIVAFVGSQKPSLLKSLFLNFVYFKVDSFVYISKYVKKEKEKQFPFIKKRNNCIIYNGTELRKDTGENFVDLNKISLLDIAGLTKIKNIEVLIKAFNILINKNKIKNIFLYVVGDGPNKNELQSLIRKFHLTENVFLLGYQKNTGGLLNSCDIFVHPCYKEGFGIVVTEAMRAEKPIIVANAGALPELIEHEKTGLVVDPHSPQKWVDAIIKLIQNYEFAKSLGSNARAKAEHKFNAQKFVENYKSLYLRLISK